MHPCGVIPLSSIVTVDSWEMSLGGQNAKHKGRLGRAPIVSGGFYKIHTSPVPEIGQLTTIPYLEFGPLLVYSHHYIELRVTSFELEIICPAK